MTTKGMLVFIYRAADGTDCTAGGVSSRATKAVVTADPASRFAGTLPALFAPHADAPLLVLTVNGCGDPILQPPRDTWPAEATHVGPMNGGNYADTSDGRWRKAVGMYGAVPVHDRFETWEVYNSMD
jgi:hypothetical protein